MDRDHCIATWDRVLIQVWHYATTAEAVARLNGLAQGLIAEARAPISSIAVVERTSPPPEDTVRTSLAKFYRDLAPQMKEQVVVAEGGGFRGAIVRAVGVTLSTLAPRALPFKFVGSVSEATTLVAPHLSRSAGGEKALFAVIDGLRADSRAYIAKM